MTAIYKFMWSKLLKRREIDRQSEASVQGSPKKRCRNTVKFLHKKIGHKFEEAGQIKPHEELVEEVIEGRDGWKKAVYLV